jgi:glycine/D-amino acid oxidase-like deaminating enzyme
MKLIQLTKGAHAIVDDADFEGLSRYNWYLTYAGYAARSTKLGPVHTIFMHRQILGLQSGEQADHRNRNKVDNRRENLRRCTGTQNQANQPKRRSYRGRKLSSPYRGVTWHGRLERWQAGISSGGRFTHLGVYFDPADAARAYDAAARERYGEFANLNFPEGAFA